MVIKKRCKKIEEVITSKEVLREDFEPSIAAYHIPTTIDLETLKNMEIETGVLKSVSLHNDGMMMGQSHKVEVDFENKTIKSEDKQGFDKPYTTYYYSVTDDDLNKIQEFINNYNLPAWSKLELNPMMTPSDTQRMLIFEYQRENKTINRIIIYPFSVMNEEERKIYNDFISYIYSLIKEDKIIKKEDKKNVSPPVFSEKYCPECGRKLDGETCECGFRLKK